MIAPASEFYVHMASVKTVYAEGLGIIITCSGVPRRTLELFLNFKM